jgi:hypothetical protein
MHCYALSVTAEPARSNRRAPSLWLEESASKSRSRGRHGTNEGVLARALRRIVARRARRRQLADNHLERYVSHYTVGSYRDGDVLQRWANAGAIDCSGGRARLMRRRLKGLAQRLEVIDCRRISSRN